MTTLERVLDVVTDAVVLPDNMSEDTVIEDLQLDSLDFAELVMAIEEEFEVDTSDEEVQGWTTFGDIVDYIDGKLP
jgi:acyl carrier protein